MCVCVCVLPHFVCVVVQVECVGDDIAWMRVGADGRLWAVNPEAGCVRACVCARVRCADVRCIEGRCLSVGRGQKMVVFAVVETNINNNKK